MNQRNLFTLLLVAMLFGVTASPLVAQLPPPVAATPEFKEKPFGPLPEPTKEPRAKPKDTEPSKPIPIGWIIGGIASGVLGIAGLLYGASKAWHSSNLFDREYRFPVESEAALRFGGKRSGGHMATVQFGQPLVLPREPQGSEAKNT